MSEPCQACHGMGYIPNDPDVSKLQVCLTCRGMGELERIKEMVERYFSQDDPDEASPEDRRTSREIAEIAAMILQEVGGEK